MFHGAHMDEAVAASEGRRGGGWQGSREWDRGKPAQGHDTDYHTPRDRDRDRERDRDRDRDRDSRSRDRDREWDREDGWDRGGYGRGDARDRDRERSQESSDGYARYPRSDHHERRGGDYPRSSEPSASIMLRGIPPKANRTDVWEAFSQHGAVLKDVRVMIDKATGESRGYAFVEFKSTEEAQKWVDGPTPIYVLDRRVYMDYSAPQGDDWICTHCNMQNFRRRNECFSCSFPRDPDAKSVPAGQRHNNRTDEDSQIPPCPVLIVKGLDFRTTEHTLYGIFSQFGKPLSVRIVRDKSTQQSRGFCFVDFATTEEAIAVLDSVQSANSQLVVDDRRGWLLAPVSTQPAHCFPGSYAGGPFPC